MLISGDKILIDFEYVEALEAGERYIFAYLASGKELRVGRYESFEQSKFALGLIENAILSEEKYFEVPHAKDVEERMNIARQHRNKVTSRKAHHGGS